MTEECRHTLSMMTLGDQNLARRLVGSAETKVNSNQERGLTLTVLPTQPVKNQNSGARQSESVVAAISYRANTFTIYDRDMYLVATGMR